MNIKKIFSLALASFSALPLSAQIMLSPCFDSSIGGLTDNNMAIVEGRLRNVISSCGAESGYGGRFVLGCKVAALQREVSGTKLIQTLEVTFTIGDNVANACFGSTSVECSGIGNTEGQAMTSALKNIKGGPQLRDLVNEAKQRIITYYEKNGRGIIMKARTLITNHNWEAALFELTQIPQECSHYPEALKMMNTVYEANLDHDAARILTVAEAMWAANPYPENAAAVMATLSRIEPDAACYPKAQALIKRVETRVKAINERDYQDQKAMEKAQLSMERRRMDTAADIEKRRLATIAAVEKARIAACRDVAVAYARRKVQINNYYRRW